MMDLAQLRALVERCAAPSAPRLYRRLYSLANGAPAPSIASWNDWRKLPFLDKQVLGATPLLERTFASWKDIDYIRASSGTTGTPPIFIPRTVPRRMNFRAEYHNFKRPVLSYLVPVTPYWFAARLPRGSTPPIVTFDPKEPGISARLARMAGVDALIVPTQVIEIAGSALVKESHAKNIRYIEIAGDTITRTLFDYLRKTFPNAVVVPQYNASEIDDPPAGVPCHPIDGSEPLEVYHPKETQFHELLDLETGSVVEPTAGAEGELVVTTYPGEPAALPLIRYRTKDVVRIVEKRCARHGIFSFAVIGRADADFLKIPGGILRADEAARVVRLFGDYITDRFELHRFEEAGAKGPRIRVELHVELKGSADLTALARDIAENLRVNPTLTYAAGVEHGRYLPLTCVPLLPAMREGKRKRLIAH